MSITVSQLTLEERLGDRNRGGLRAIGGATAVASARSGGQSITAPKGVVKMSWSGSCGGIRSRKVKMLCVDMCLCSMHKLCPH